MALILRLAALLLSFGLAGGAVAQCAGTDLIATLPADTRAGLRAATDAAPHARGNLWRATRDGQTVTLAGTYHLDDPRHDGLMTTIGPLVAGATRVLVEAGPEEEAKLMALLARDPSAILAPEGPTLAETLPPDEWTRLSEAMRDRGIPPFMVSRFRPWYITVLLSVPPCAVKQAANGNGLDKRILAVAQDRGIPVQALEPFDTALKLFDSMDAAAQLAMVRSTLALEHQAADQMATLASAYFAEDSRLIWEYTRHVTLAMPGMTKAQVDAEFAAMEETLMNRRNADWIPVIEEAAAQGPVFAAFGALHLSGRAGVLALLADNGWTITRLPLP